MEGSNLPCKLSSNPILIHIHRDNKYIHEKTIQIKFKLKTAYYGGVIIQYDYCPSKKRKEPQGNLCSENRQFEDITRSLQPQGSLREKQSFLISRRVRKYISVFCLLPRGVV